jgi:Homeodomain-like domain
VEEIELRKSLEKGLSTRKIADENSVSQSTVKHWLKKYGLRSNVKAGHPGGSHEHLCGCGETNPRQFYARMKSCCKACQNKKRCSEFVEKKKKAIVHFGGRCVDCGYSKYYGALEFHHLDITQKEISPQKALKREWTNALKELSKCVLLCSNCHRERHALIAV